MHFSTLNIVLFDGFETLDAMGPAEVFGSLPSCRLRFISREGGPVVSTQGVIVQTGIAAPGGEALLIPGGQGTRTRVDDGEYLHWLYGLANASNVCMTVCTGSALLAKTGLLDGVRATTNKRAYGWVTSLRQQVHWQPRARWVHDGKFWTSSGISAGMDMALGAVAENDGVAQAEALAGKMEYCWNRNPDEDPFACG